MGESVFFRPPLRVKISGGFVLLLAVLLFLDEGGVIAAAAPAVFVHELCHVGAMRCFGARAVGLEATAAGLSLDYAGFAGPGALAATALAGPAGGAGFALLCAHTGAALGSEYWQLSAGIGMVFSCFNLLPALPLDGGVAAEIFLRRVLGEGAAAGIMTALGFITTGGILAFGAALFHYGCGGALLAAGVWLGGFQIKRTCK